mmetsp:Transcript_23608/g.49429  ORF Transcript_23608/g.49429 Transcript_23608/m.49429 type:complete len:485 (-) Transcript_23608:229-1683(-)
MESVELSESEREDSESSITSSEEHAFEGGESESQSDGDDDGDVARCAICFLKDDQNHNWRRLMHLPCCGGNGKEATSTMRFCAACLLQLSRDAIVKETYDDMRRPEPNSIFPSNNYLVHTDQNRQSPMPERRFYQHDCQAHERRFIDCPRCKDILIVDMKKIARSHQACDYENGDWTNPKNADSISLRRPTFKGRCQYAAEVESTARIVFTVAMLNANLLPIEVLKSTEDDISRMLRWRILHRVPGEENGDVFMMKKEEHLKLIQFLNMDRWTHTDASFRKEVYDNLRIVLLDGMSAAFVNHLKTFRLVTALRLISRLLYYCFPARELSLTPCSEGKELAIAVIIASTCTVTGYFISIQTVRFVAYTGFLIRDVFALILAIPPTTIAFGIACGVLGFVCGQRNSTLTSADIVQRISLHMPSVRMISGETLQTAKHCGWQSICFVGRTIFLTVGIFIVTLLDGVKSIFDFLSTQLAIIMASVERR